ncbi:MAG: SMC family ATPase, partial [Spirochaetales bacterium]|nr:SMC family ATPase [Spirochaetales bacterium]
IETLFGLQRFNLSSRCNMLLARSREECSFLEGRLQDLQDLKEENLEELRETARLAEEELSGKSERREKLSVLLTELREAEKTGRALRESSEALQTMDARMESIRREEEFLEKSRTLEEQFTPLLSRQQELKDEERILLQERETHTRKREGIEAELSRGSEEWKRLSEDQEKYAALKRSLDSLTARRELQALQEQLDRDRLRITALENELRDVSGRKRELEESTAVKVKEQEALEQRLDGAQELNSLDRWYRTRDEIDQKTENLGISAAEMEEQNRRERDSLAALAEFETGFPAKEVQEKLLEEFDRRESEFLERQHRLELTGELSRLAPLLKEGEPCPLCGSDHHPHPPAADSTHETEFRTLQQEREALRSRKEGALRLLPSLLFREEEMEKVHTSLKEQEELLKRHMLEFHWTGFSPDDREAFRKAGEELSLAAESLRSCREELKDLEKQTSLVDSAAAEKEREMLHLETGCEHYLRQMDSLGEKILKEEEYSETIDSLELRLSAVDRDFQRIRSFRREREETLQEISSALASSGRLLEKTEAELRSLTEKITSALNAGGIEDLSSLKRLLVPAEERQARLEKTAAFRRERDSLAERCKALNEEMEKLRERIPPGSSLQETEEALNLMNRELSQLHARSGGLKQQIADLSGKLELKESLAAELEKQAARLENLKELSGLFKGGKFVQYIASVYMQELCAMANSRFSPLSGRSLELVFQDNQIMVRDFLNEGRLRHIKTLSGGQSFQAALCLALSLSEQTGRGKGSFFFLDEGFGSLDKASLETVMSTLRQLSREGRIIGLISHVEEMQQDLDVWLKIRQDTERGSRITSSWEKGV